MIGPGTGSEGRGKLLKLLPASPSVTVTVTLRRPCASALGAGGTGLLAQLTMDAVMVLVVPSSRLNVPVRR